MSFFSSLEQRSSISKQNSFQTGSNLSFSCGSETRVPLWLQSSEDMEKCSKGRVTWNLLLFLSWLLDCTGLVFIPQVNLYPSPSLVYIPSHFLLIKFTLVNNKGHFPCRVLWLHLSVHADRFSFLFFKYWCLFSMWACSLTVSRGGGLHSSLFFFLSAKNDSDSHERLRITVLEVIGWTKWRFLQNKCSVFWLYIRITKRAFKMQEYLCPGPLSRRIFLNGSGEGPWHC